MRIVTVPNNVSREELIEKVQTELNAMRPHSEALVLLDGKTIPYSSKTVQVKDVLILGAWGCGVFKQDPETVAKLIRNTTWRGVKKIVLAVIDKPTYGIFKGVFSNE